MLSISNVKTAGGAVSYFADHLITEGVNCSNAHEDYYAADEPGQWLGTGSEALGLQGEVNATDFARMLLAIDEDDKPMVIGGGEADRRAGWDLTFSAPKSVSSLWAVADDQTHDAIEQAHANAVETAMTWLEESGGISARRGKGGAELECAALVAARFDHGTSREQDPQIHSHCFVMNLAQRQDGSWGAIQSKEFFSRKMAAGALYRSALADQLQQLGFGIERDKKSFAVIGVPDQLQQEWSKRRGQVLAEIAAHGGRTAKSAEAAALNSRRGKEGISQDLLLDRWKKEAAEHDFFAETVSDLQAQKNDRPEPMQSSSELWRELTKHASTISERQVEATIFEKSQGVLSPDSAKQFLNDFVRDPKTVVLRDATGNRRFTSAEMLALEQSIISNAQQRQNENSAIAETHVTEALAAVPSISDEQWEMVEHITGKGGVVVVEGRAGTGKSFALGVAKRAWQLSGKNVIGAALAGKAAESLEDGSGIKSQTLHSLLYELTPDPVTSQPAKYSLTKNDVVVLDEAGMVGSRQMSQLLNLAGQAGAKVVLVGDSKQLQPIDAGGAFRGLSKSLGAARLTDIRRQKNAWHRDAVTALSEGDAGRALKAFSDHGLLQTGGDREATIGKMVDKWRQDRISNPASSSLMLAGTRADVAAINRAARLATADQLDGPITKINGHDFQSGDRLLFTKNSKELGVKNGTLGTVLHSLAEGKMAVLLDEIGRTVIVDKERYESVQHGYAVTVHKAQGATLDTAYVLAHESMSGQEWAYVAASRSRNETTIFADSDLISELDLVMGRSQSQDLSTDYQLEAA
ncbi:MobF family relaxase [Methylophaga nitratireducenticrescens]|uniref:MobF family relaxase n=1 Tax=Methylophaga nitratireducenticrescens TaxID=754476 RepID=UPI000CDBBAF4|nr:MobF family relaxase [Methylophaga nitratireducenticrescens]AUZ85142.1 hypothetical protein CDW43_11435 [Methylophaga nitratireducenticrescens]